MKGKQVISLVLAAMTVVATAGCGEKQKQEDGQIVLKYVMPGPGRQKDSAEVWSAVNDKIHETYPNISLDIDVIAAGDYKQTFLLMQTGKEQMDIVNTYGLNFEGEVDNGTLCELDSLLDEYGAGIKEQLPDWLMNYMRVNDKLYGIPSYQALANERALFTPKEYADKWLDVEALKKELYSSDYITQGTVDIIEDYFQKLSDNGKIYYGAVPYNELPCKGYEGLKNNFIVDIKTHEVKYKFEVASVKEQYKRHAEWYKKGWIRKDAQSNTDSGEKKGRIDGYVLYDGGFDPWTQENTAQETGVEMLVIPFSDKYFIPMSSVAGGTAITASCEHPKEAMQIINLFQSDKELYNLLTYGIEGKHYKKINEERIETPYGLQVSSSDDYGIYSWIVGNTQLAYLVQGRPDDFKKWMFEEVNTSEYRSDLIGLNVRVDEVADSIAQLDAIKGEYMLTLTTGVLGDGWEEYYNEWMKKADTAGLQETKKVLQKQVNEFLANKK